jgi:hypothetical protein
MTDFYLQALVGQLRQHTSQMEHGQALATEYFSAAVLRVMALSAVPFARLRVLHPLVLVWLSVLLFHFSFGCSTIHTVVSLSIKQQ